MAHASKRKQERPWHSRQWGRTDTEEVLAQAFITQTAPPAVSASPADATPDAESRVAELQRPETPNEAVADIHSETTPGVVTAPDAIAPSPAVTAPPAVSLRGSKEKTVHKCTIVQHGHSITDQMVYQFLWARGIAEAADRPNGNRIVSMGITQIAKQLGTIHERNVPIILNRLIGKQSVEVISREVSDEGQPRQYRVFGYEEIMMRRERLGLTHVIRSSRGVDFVDPQTKQPIELRIKLKRQTAPPAVSAPPANTAPGATMPSDAMTTTDAVTASESPDVIAAAPPDVSAPHLKKELKEKKKESTSTEFSEKLREWIEKIDQDAIDRIWRDSHALQPNLSLEELLDCVRDKLISMQRNKRIENPVGLLLSSIPQWVRRKS